VHDRQGREAQIAHQREQFRKRQRNKRIFNYAILAIILLAIAYGIYAYITSKSAPGEHDALAQCLTRKGVTMYGTDWCPHCQEQKREFGASFKYVTYINCDLQSDACKAAGVEGYPTWVFPSGPKAEGTQQLATLADRAGCPQ
jgi:hypothetical protein